MSRRPGVLVSSYVDADRGLPPNRYSMGVTCEIRCFWPPLATDEQIAQALADAHALAVAAVAAKRLRSDRR